MVGFFRPIQRSVLFFLTLLLVGCGGNSVTPNPGPANPGPWTYVALGDSLAEGFTATQGYVPRYADYARTDTGATITLNNLGQSGWTSADLLNALRTDTSLRTAVSSANIVTWNIGGNDLLGASQAFLTGTCGGTDNLDCFRATLATFKTNWDGIVTEIVALRSTSNTALRTMDIYNPFVAEQLRLGNLQQTKPFLDEMDTYIQTTTQQRGIPCAKVYAAFNGPAGDEDASAKGLIAPDQFHANDNGHKLMADLLRGLGYAPLK